MISGGEDVGDAVTAEVGGSGVVGVVEQAAGAVGGRRYGAGEVGGAGVGDAEAFKAGGIGVAEYAGEQADHGIDDDGGGEFSAGEDVVADGEFAIAEQVVDAFVDALVASADEDHAIGLDELGGDGLGEGAALRGKEDDGLARGVAGGAGCEGERIEASEDGFRLEDHAFAAAEGPVVDGAMPIVSEAAEIMRGN